MLPVSTLEQIIGDLRDAVGPVILISGVGLLLLTMTNRLGRAIDWARELQGSLFKQSKAERLATQAQIHTIYRRAKFLRAAIVLAVLSAMLAAILVMGIFIATWWGWQSAGLVAVVFTACLACLSASLVCFLIDINLSLTALKLELKHLPPD